MPFIWIAAKWAALRATASAALPTVKPATAVSWAVWGCVALVLSWWVITIPGRAERHAAAKFEAAAHKATADRLREEIRLRALADQAATHARAQVALLARAQEQTQGSLEEALTALAMSKAEAAGKGAPLRPPFYPPSVVKGIYQ